MVDPITAAVIGAATARALGVGIAGIKAGHTRFANRNGEVHRAIESAARLAAEAFRVGLAPWLVGDAEGREALERAGEALGKDLWRALVDRDPPLPRALESAARIAAPGAGRGEIAEAWLQACAAYLMHATAALREHGLLLAEMEQLDIAQRHVAVADDTRELVAALLDSFLENVEMQRLSQRGAKRDAEADRTFARVHALEKHRRRLQERYGTVDTRGLYYDQGMPIVGIPLVDVFVPPRLLPWSPPRGGQATQPVSLDHALFARRVCVLFGEPGQGKSTLARILTLGLYGVEGARKYCPVLARARPVVLHLELRHLRDKLVDDTLRVAIAQTHVDLDLDRLANHRALVIILDGFDELTEKSLRQRVAGQIKELWIDWPRARVLVTSRAHGRDDLAILGPDNLLRLAPFEHDEVVCFFDKWLGALSRIRAQVHGSESASNESRARALALVGALDREPRVREIAQNPLLCTLIAILSVRHANREDDLNSSFDRLVDTPARFLQRAVGVLAERWEYAKEGGIAQPSVLHECLQMIAFRSVLKTLDDLDNATIGIWLREYLSARELANSADEANWFIGQITERLGLLVWIGERDVMGQSVKIHRFLHPALRSHLAGGFLRHVKVRRTNDRYIVFRRLLHNPDWDEALALYTETASQVSEAEVTDLFEWLLDDLSVTDTVVTNLSERARILLFALRWIRRQARRPPELDELLARALGHCLPAIAVYPELVHGLELLRWTETAHAIVTTAVEAWPQAHEAFKGQAIDALLRWAPPDMVAADDAIDVDALQSGADPETTQHLRAVVDIKNGTLGQRTAALRALLEKEDGDIYLWLLTHRESIPAAVLDDVAESWASVLTVALSPGRLSASDVEWLCARIEGDGLVQGFTALGKHRIASQDARRLAAERLKRAEPSIAEPEADGTWPNPVESEALLYLIDVGDPEGQAHEAVSRFRESQPPELTGWDDFWRRYFFVNARTEGDVRSLLDHRPTTPDDELRFLDRALSVAAGLPGDRRRRLLTDVRAWSTAPETAIFASRFEALQVDISDVIDRWRWQAVVRSV